MFFLKLITNFKQLKILRDSNSFETSVSVIISMVRCTTEKMIPNL